MLPFLRTVTAGREHPRRAAGGGRRALLRVRRPQPHQRPEPGPAGRAAGRARPPRDRHPAASGATATSPVRHRRPARGARRAAYAGCVTVVTSAYSSYSSCRQYREDLAARGRRRWPTPGPTLGVDKVRHLLPTTPASPGPTAAWSPRPARGAARGPARRRPAAVRHPLDPDGDGRDVRPRRRRGHAYAASTSRSGRRSPTRSTRRSAPT